MKRLGFLAALATAALLVAGCATTPSQPPLTGPGIVVLAKSGATAPQIIEELKRTNTVLMLQASDFVRLHEAGVPSDVIDYLQQQMIAEIRWRDWQNQAYWYGPYWRGYYGWGPCPPGWRRC
jgi:hypothetical protein